VRFVSRCITFACDFDEKDSRSIFDITYEVIPNFFTHHRFGARREPVLREGSDWIKFKLIVPA
jgi:hypothetical protein